MEKELKAIALGIQVRVHNWVAPPQCDVKGSRSVVRPVGSGKRWKGRGKFCSPPK